MPTQHVHDGTNAVEPGGSAGVSAGPPGSGGDGQFFAHALHHAREQPLTRHASMRVMTAAAYARSWMIETGSFTACRRESESWKGLLAQQLGRERGLRKRVAGKLRDSRDRARRTGVHSH